MSLSLSALTGGTLELYRDLELDCLSEQPEGQRSVYVRLLTLEEIRDIYPVNDKGELTGTDGPEQVKAVLKASLVDSQSKARCTDEQVELFTRSQPGVMISELMQKITAANQGSEPGEP